MFTSSRLNIFKSFRWYRLPWYLEKSRFS